MDKQELRGIWKYENLLPEIDEKFRLSLSEGNTPLITVGNLLLKCEYVNPTGSIKDRGMAYVISKLKSHKITKTVISSSGNAAISAATYCKLAGISLAVFVSPKINKAKLRQLRKLPCEVIINSHPISSAVKYSNLNQAYNLRQSTDPLAPIGGMTIAFELHQDNPLIDAVFIPVSSGTNLVGIAQGYGKLGAVLPAMHAVQTEAVNTVSGFFDKEYQIKTTSLSDGIVAKHTARREAIIKLIKQSKGWGWVISDKEIIKARQYLISKKINCSFEGAATLAAYWKSQLKGFSYKKPVCILTGRYYEQS